jgi:alkylation response protein AidB-like acyl-CoA dehydrogenase
MDYGITEEQRQIQALTRRFVEDELWPHEEAIERDDVMPAALRRALRARAAELGLFAFNMPAEVGGPGLPYITQVLIREQLGRVSVALADVVGRPPRALLSCRGEQRERFLLPSVRGDRTWAFALTEPGAGSDAGALKTSARQVPGGYALNGTKHFISHGDTADFVIVFARVAPENALAAFLVERDTSGFSVGRVHPKMGWRGYPIAELVFEDAFVPEANLLGDVGQGMRIAMGNINEARIGVAAHCVGMAQRALDLATEHARVRRQFEQPIARFQGVQWMLADMAVAVAQSRALLYAAARAMDGPGRARASVSMAKLSCTEMVAAVADRALQLFGGAGYVAESPIEMIYRDARAFRIGEGTSEIQRNQIAAALLDGELSA